MSEWAKDTNARYLASRGWAVTGVEESGEGARQAREQCSRVDVVYSAIEEFDLGRERWDLIIGMYVHGVMLRESARIIEALRPGGLLVVEGFHRDVMQEARGLADWWRIDAPLVRMVARK